MLKNLAQVTSVAAERFGSKPALIFEGRWFSFGEIDALACRLDFLACGLDVWVLGQSVSNARLHRLGTGKR